QSDDAAVAVADTGLIVQVPAAGGQLTFDERADEMHRNEFPAELNYLRPADRRLQPLSMVKRGVPPVDRRVIAAEGRLQLVAVIEPDDDAFDFRVEAGRGRRAGARVRPGGERQFAENIHARRQGCREMEHELSFAEPA